MRQALVLITLATLMTVPALYLRVTGSHIELVTDTALYGLAIVAAAFLLAWAAEAAEVDISQALAVAFIAFVAVLPEYAVDLTFAWKAGQDPEFAPFAVANMTGANRLLIGLGWSAVFFIFWIRTRGHVLSLGRGNALDVVALGAATLYSFTIPLKGSISLFDTLILFAIFIAYIYGVSRAEGEEPHLVGPAAWLGGLAQKRRRAANAWLFIFSAAVILASAEHFAEGLVESGTKLGIDEFLLVQWLAPLASEAPEFLIAGILAFRGRAAMGLAALLSSKVNQWTLLVGGLAGGVQHLGRDAGWFAAGRPADRGSASDGGAVAVRGDGAGQSQPWTLRGGSAARPVPDPVPDPDQRGAAGDRGHLHRAGGGADGPRAPRAAAADRVGADGDPGPGAAGGGVQRGRLARLSATERDCRMVSYALS